MWVFATLLLASTVQNPPKQTTCPDNLPLSIDVSLSPSSLKSNQTTSVEVEGENTSEDDITLVTMTLVLQQDDQVLEYTFFVNNEPDVSPGQNYKVTGQWTPDIENWPNGSANLLTILGDENNYAVGCKLDSVNISAMTLGLAAALLLSLNS